MYYISKNYKALFSAAGKAKTDYEFALESDGFKNLGFKQSSIPNSFIGAVKNFFGISLALIRLPFKATLCTQYPINKYRKYILFVANLKKCKIITLVHDVRFLRGRTEDRAAELKNICTSGGVIVHNPTMKQWLVNQGVDAKIAVLELFDYISETRPSQNDKKSTGEKYVLTYAGGFSDERGKYIYDFDTLNLEHYSLNLYGKGFNETKVKVDDSISILNYKGFFPSKEIAHKIKGDFGLVWDGISLDTCDGQYGEYLKFNNPHKTSLYILSGLPVVIWSEAALAPFIKDNNLGVCVASLKDLDEVLGKMTKEDYLLLKKSVLEYQKKVMSGYFFKKATKYLIEK
ncbi:beta-1,6-galactofuranosyltransferase [Seonamhaeicola sp. MEBiC1930]|uniref:beta-1,6-galactofuranosyltransferase n=1 Tax=Seonamhaeicola sp. MEBiC01930 TaxID=2976768 RepID=UPI003254439F